MREFKFRIWDTSNKEMYNKVIVGNYPDTAPMVWCDYNGKPDWYHIEPKVCKVMQYTGYKDVKGQEIYEGDILAHQDYFWWVRIEYYNGSFMVRDVKRIRYTNKVCGKHIGDFDTSKLRVIGNIYENEELFLELYYEYK